MAHLTCARHHKRVVVLPDQQVVHRNGVGDKCETMMLRIDGHAFMRDEVVADDWRGPTTTWPRRVGDSTQASYRPPSRNYSRRADAELRRERQVRS